MADRRDHGDVRVSRVRRVESASESDLDDGDRARGRREMPERERRGQFEGRRLAGRWDQPSHRSDLGAHADDRALQIRGGDDLAVDAYALAIALQVRLRVQAGANARCREQARQQRRRRSLALGPGDQDDREPPVRRAEQIEQYARAAKIPLQRRIRARIPAHAAGGVREAEEPVEAGGRG